MRLQNFINEKVTKKELSDTLKNDNLWIGAEFEFKIRGLESTEDPQARRDYSHALVDWERIHDDKDDYSEELNRLSNQIDDITNDLIDAYDNYDKEMELQRDDKKIQFWKEKHEKLQDEKEDLEKEFDELQDDPFWANKDYSDYFNYWSNYFDINDIYLIDDDFPRPPDIEESPEYFENDLSDFNNWEDVISDIAEDMYKDADFMSKYKLGDYKSVEQKKGSNTWAFEYDQSISPDGGVEVKSPPMKLPEFIKILPNVLKWIKKWGFADRDCGLHFHMSLETGVLDYYKIIVFTEENLIFKYFPERIHNTYTKEVKDKLMKSTPTSTKQAIERATKRKAKKDDINLALLGSDKFDAINKISQEHNRVEFRYMGGAGYENKHKEIEELIKRYAFALSVACDPEWRWKEYIQRMQRILNKMDKFLLEKELEGIKSEIRSIESDKPSHIMNFVETNRAWVTLTDSEKKYIKQILENKFKEVLGRFKSLKVKIPDYMVVHSQITYKEFYKNEIDKITKYLKK